MTERIRVCGPVTINSGRHERDSQLRLSVQVWSAARRLELEVRTQRRYWEFRRTRGWFRIQRRMDIPLREREGA